MLIGFSLNYFEVPFSDSLQNILLPIQKIALPTVLISMGMALGGFKISTQISYSLTLTLLKNILHPLLAFVIAKYIFTLSEELIFIITLAAALPSGSQTYYFSYRYNSLQKIISTNVVISTFLSFFTISLILIIF